MVDNSVVLLWDDWFCNYEMVHFQQQTKSHSPVDLFSIFDAGQLPISCVFFWNWGFLILINFIIECISHSEQIIAGSLESA